jgi:thiol:disulfide interchange protein DsbA
MKATATKTTAAKRITMAVLMPTLLLIVGTGCGQQPPPATPAPAAKSVAPSPAPLPSPQIATASVKSRQSSPEDASNVIAAGEEVDNGDENPAPNANTTANTLLAQALAPPAAPAPASTWKEGVNYQLLTPTQSTNAPPDKVEVIEVFWYGCSHCYAFEPFLEGWKAKKASYVQFTRLPVTWGPVHQAHARLFYTLAALGKGEELHSAVFREIHVNQNPLVSKTSDPVETEQIQLAFAKNHGIKEDEFRRAYHSFMVETNLQRAADLVRRYRVEGVPLVVINGKYIADVGTAGGQSQLISLINYLAAREQKKE